MSQKRFDFKIIKFIMPHMKLHKNYYKLLKKHAQIYLYILTGFVCFIYILGIIYNCFLTAFYISIFFSFILILLYIIVGFIWHIVAYFIEKYKWNKGICRKCENPWEDQLLDDYEFYWCKCNIFLPIFQWKKLHKN